jgi:hypothetical protein
MLVSITTEYEYKPMFKNILHTSTQKSAHLCLLDF